MTFPTDFRVPDSNPTPKGPNWAVVGCLLFYAVLAAWIVWRMNR